ncbi:hypothetical protein WHR41_03411 [Cladosporium halotolerans]|uniref:RING-type domain-containing protein n=1 Tax=Cladosporium halotolerans TaxID=1052096 RepID=A0AB34KWL9_9PEZI
MAAERQQHPHIIDPVDDSDDDSYEPPDAFAYQVGNDLEDEVDRAAANPPAAAAAAEVAAAGPGVALPGLAAPLAAAVAFGAQPEDEIHNFPGANDDNFLDNRFFNRAVLGACNEPQQRAGAHQEPAGDVLMPDRDSQDAAFADGNCYLILDHVLARLYEIFPDAWPNYLVFLYFLLTYENPGISAACCEDQIVEKMLSNKDYPRRSKDLPALGLKRSNIVDEELEWWKSDDRVALPALARGTIKSMLKADFPQIGGADIKRIAQEEQRFFQAYVRLAQLNDTDPHVSRHGRPPINDASAEFIAINSGWAQLPYELTAARKQVAIDRAIRAEKERIDQLEADNLQRAIADGRTANCQVCFDHMPMNRQAHCNGDEAHFTCWDCMELYVKVQVGDARCPILCPAGCGAGFDPAQMNLLPNKELLEKLGALQREKDIREAQLEGLAECPFCEYKVILPPIEEDFEFQCANPACGRVSCRHCKAISHTPLSCEQHAKDNAIETRHKIEEAMTAALIRTCNRCKKPFIKEYGCNKMVCPSCGNKQCYVCSENVEEYNHFGGHPDNVPRPGNEARCPLFDNLEERHEREIRDAQEAARAEILAANPNVDPDHLDIRMSDAVNDATAERIRQAGPQGLGVDPMDEEEFLGGFEPPVPQPGNEGFQPPEADIRQFEVENDAAGGNPVRHRRRDGPPIEAVRYLYDLLAGIAEDRPVQPAQVQELLRLARVGEDPQDDDQHPPGAGRAVVAEADAAPAEQAGNDPRPRIALAQRFRDIDHPGEANNLNRNQNDNPLYRPEAVGRPALNADPARDGHAPPPVPAFGGNFPLNLPVDNNNNAPDPRGAANANGNRNAPAQPADNNAHVPGMLGYGNGNIAPALPAANDPRLRRAGRDNDAPALPAANDPRLRRAGRDNDAPALPALADNNNNAPWMHGLGYGDDAPAPPALADNNNNAPWMHGLGYSNIAPAPPALADNNNNAPWMHGLGYGNIAPAPPALADNNNNAPWMHGLGYGNIAPAQPALADNNNNAPWMHGLGYGNIAPAQPAGAGDNAPWMRGLGYGNIAPAPPAPADDNVPGMLGIGDGNIAPAPPANPQDNAIPNFHITPELVQALARLPGVHVPQGLLLQAQATQAQAPQDQVPQPQLPLPQYQPAYFPPPQFPQPQFPQPQANDYALARYQQELYDAENQWRAHGQGNGVAGQNHLLAAPAPRGQRGQRRARGQGNGMARRNRNQAAPAAQGQDDQRRTYGQDDQRRTYGQGGQRRPNRWENAPRGRRGGRRGNRGQNANRNEQ